MSPLPFDISMISCHFPLPSCLGDVASCQPSLVSETRHVMYILVLQEAPRTVSNAFECSALIKACGKMELLSKMLRHIYGSEHRVLIFSQVCHVDGYCQPIPNEGGCCWRPIPNEGGCCWRPILTRVVVAGAQSLTRVVVAGAQSLTMVFVASYSLFNPSCFRLFCVWLCEDCRATMPSDTC